MSDLDPLDRQKTDEPRFVLLARDPLSDGLVALWAALRGRHLHKVNDIVKNLVVTAGGLPYRPDADPAHVISAQQVSNAMMIWRTKNTPKTPTNARSVELNLDQPVGEAPNRQRIAQSEFTTREIAADTATGPGSEQAPAPLEDV